MPGSPPDTAGVRIAFRDLAASVPEVRWVATEAADGALYDLPWVPYGDGFEVPFYFKYDGGGPVEWTMDVLYYEGRLRCIRLDMRSLDPRSTVTPELVHDFPVGRLVQEAALYASRPADQIPRRYKLWKNADEARKAHSAVAMQHRRRPEDRKRINDELLAEVAEVYRRHMPTGKPSQAVAEHFHYSPASARRIVAQARARGHLGPARPGRIGEHANEGGS